MYFDLFVPFPVPEEPFPTSKKKKDKGKGKSAILEAGSKSCWDGLLPGDKDRFARSVALAGHLGYSAIGCTVSREPSSDAVPSPFRSALPYPELDPRHRQAGPSSGPAMLQISRHHMRLHDPKTQLMHCLTGANANTLRDYDLLSVQPMDDKALQIACTDLSNPGPNQLSIISLPLHEKPYYLRLNRKQIRQAQRNGVVIEILYAAGLFPPASTPLDVARRYRQNFMSNARELVRLTGGKGVIFSSGPGGSVEGMRGPLDVINLATMLGMPANLAKDAVSLNPKMVLLRAQARRTFKAILGAPKMVAPIPGDQHDQEEDVEDSAAMAQKRNIDPHAEIPAKRSRIS